MEKFTDWLNESKEEDKVQKYKKKPVTVEAIKWTGDNFEDVKSFAGKNVKIDGDRLALGTNLFSDKDTIIEEMGYDVYMNQINRFSNFYNKNIDMR